MDITRRDRFIIGKALLYTIKYVDNLPEHVREQSERDDMVRLLKMLSPKTIEMAKIASRLPRLGAQGRQTGRYRSRKALRDPGRLKKNPTPRVAKVQIETPVL
jgi:hypothetical protein